MSSPAPFDWKSLITPAIAFGSKILGDTVAPSVDQQLARSNIQQNQFNRDIQLAKMAQANNIRQKTMPGMFTNLGFSPGQGRQMTSEYGAAAPNLPAVAPGSQASGGGAGSTIGKAALGAGISLAPSIIGGLAKKGAIGAVGKTLGGAAGTIAGAAGGLALPIAGAALAAGLIWKKSQAHPTADKWVQGEQDPFDKHWIELDRMGLPPDQLQQAKTESAQNYLRELAAFAQEGGKNMEVARNAARTFREYYGDPMKYGIQLPF